MGPNPCARVPMGHNWLTLKRELSMKLFLDSAVRAGGPIALSVLVFSAIGCGHNAVVADTQQRPVAAVTTVERAHLESSFHTAGEFVPFQEVELHAKVAGYIRRINVDIGDRVRAGQVLATLDVPEL